MAPKPPILWDCDGTLVDTEELSSAAVADSLGSFGVVMSPEDVNRVFIGVHLDDIVRIVNTEHGKSIDPVEFTAVYTPNMIKNVPGHIRVLPDTVAYVKSLYDRGYPMAVGSNGVREVVKLELEVAGLLQYFNAVVTADDVPRAKPFPDMFLEGMRQLGWNDPSTCHVIEDSVPGTKGAVAAGMIPIGYTGLNPNPGGLAPKLLAAGAKRVLKALPELDFLLS